MGVQANRSRHTTQRVFQKAYSEQPRSASHWSFILTCWCPWPHPRTRSALRSPASYSRRITCRLNAASGSNLVWSLLLSQRILSGFVLNTCKKRSPIKIVKVSQGNIRSFQHLPGDSFCVPTRITIQVKTLKYPSSQGALNLMAMHRWNNNTNMHTNKSLQFALYEKELGCGSLVGLF